jgi:hypothetical protein
VVVGAGAWLGRIPIYLGITSDGPATESTQLAGRGGCTRLKTSCMNNSSIKLT